MSGWLQSHPLTVIGLVTWAAGILWLMPGKLPGITRPRIPGLLLALAGVVMFALSTGRSNGVFSEDVMFWVFGLSALFCGVLMITAINPVYAALWFALTTLATCGLFLLQSAPFLAAATVIVYAGAVIVTFLFVIMLAQQSGAAGYDRQSSQGFLATITAFVLLGAIAMTLQTEKLEFATPVAQMESVPEVAAVAETTPMSTPAPTQGNAPAQPMGMSLPDAEPTVPPVPGNLLSKADEDHPVGNLKGLGRSLFGDYLFAVELAGTLLLIASIGAIAIAPRREQGAI
jgi:NADH-quinone oxidoreductase subunit J